MLEERLDKGICLDSADETEHSENSTEDISEDNREEVQLLLQNADNE